MLSVRAGVGRAAPASLRQAARRLGISARRAAALERSGLQRLRAVGRSGACGAGSGGGGGGGGVALTGGSGLSSVPALQPTVVLASRARLVSTDKLGAGRARASADRPTRGSTAAADDAADSGRAIKRAGVVAAGDADSSKLLAYLATLAILALLLGAFVVAWRRRNEPGAPRLAEQTGTAAVWWPPSPDAPEAAPPAGPGANVASTAGVAAVAAGSSAQAGTEAPASPDRGHDGEPAAAASSAPTGSARGPRRPAAVAAASLLSLGFAVLRRRRRR